MKFSRRVLAIALCLLASTISVACQAQEAQSQGEFVVVIAKDADATYDDDIVRFQEDMATLGYVEGENITYLTLLQNETLADERYLTREFDAYYIANPDRLTDLLQSKDDDIPVIARAIGPNSLSPDQVFSLENSGRQITGSIIVPPGLDILSLLKELFPEVVNPYVPVEQGTIATGIMITNTEAVAADLGISPTIKVVPSTVEDVELAIDTLPADIDTIAILPGGHTDEDVCALWEGAAQARGIVFVLVKGNSVPWCTPSVTIIVDSSVAGSTSAQQMDQLLQGTPVARIPIESMTWEQIVVDQDALEAAGIELSAAAYNRDDVIITGTEEQQ